MFLIFNLLNFLVLAGYVHPKVAPFSISKKPCKKIKKKVRKIFLHQKSVKNFELILRLKRKNLFITLLNKDGNIVFKTNIGSCGFKKKVKFTGFALEQTCATFGKKIHLRLVQILNAKAKILWRRITKFKIIFRTYLYDAVLGLYKKNLTEVHKEQKILSKNAITSSFWALRLREKNEASLAAFEKRLKFVSSAEKARRFDFIARFVAVKNMSLLLASYRAYRYKKYSDVKKDKKKAELFITLIIKNNLKYWPFRYIMKGLSSEKKNIYLFNKIEARVPVPHSLGFRLKKKRRV